MKLHLALLAPLLLTAQPADTASAQRWARYNDLKFGMFIHWGPYSAASVEASWPIMVPGKWGISEAEYRKLPESFNPTRFDPAAWVDLAKSAGQRYMVFTTKHHDGFCMFDSVYTDYKLTRTPFKKDAVALLAAAAATARMPLGFYYSPPDMNHPGYRDTSKLSSANWRGEPTRPEWPLYLDYMERQLRELLTSYGDVLVVWFDGLLDTNPDRRYDPYRIHRMIRELQPYALINNRIGLPGDFGTPEQRVPKGVPTRKGALGYVTDDDAGISSAPPSAKDFLPWETCMTINDTWAYNRNDRNFKSASTLIRALIDTASRGGNFLLNVGPAPDGTIQPEFQERLLAIGAWLKTNGEAIYGSTYGPIQNLSWARTTAKPGTVYLHLLDWPQSPVILAGWKPKAASVTLLATGEPLRFQQTAAGLTIDVPVAPPGDGPAVLRIRTAR